MGGFLLYKKNAQKVDIKKSLKIFEEKKLTINTQFDFLDFQIFTFNKRSFNNKNFFRFDGSDFIASIGTPIYKNKTGNKGAQELYEDLLKSVDLDFADFKGHYCYIININNKLLIFNDYNGSYHVYNDKDNFIYSNSFLALSESIGEKAVSTQELYEYIFFASTYGEKTILKNIDQLSNKFIFELSPERKKVKKNYTLDTEPNYLNYDELVQFTSDRINDYFSLVLENFNSISLGLSGGFDSRLLLMCLLKNNKKPNVYTHGTLNSFDVQFAREICKTYDLDFTHDDSNLEAPKTTGEFKKLINEKFINTDGIVYNGVFSSFGKSMDIENSKRAELNLNGAGGEIYRSFWKLPGKALYINDYTNSRYNNFDLTIPTKLFDKSEFFNLFGEKNINSLDVQPNSSKIPGNLIELIYPNFRLKYWFGKTTSRLNQFCYALVPFAEPYFYFYSYSIPLKFKIGGKFEAALLKKINPDIAKYNSNYGFNFYDGPPPKYKILDWFKLHTPIPVRPLLRVIKSRQSAGLEKLKETSRIIFDEPYLIDEYINRDKVKNLDMYSRILTIEFYLKNFM